MPTLFARLLLAACLVGTFAIWSAGGAEAEDSAYATSPTDTLSMPREEHLVRSGQEFFKGALFVGAETCKSCHEKQDKEWRATWHSKMERLPSPDAVVGDFDDRVVTYKNAVVKTKAGKKVRISPSVKAIRAGDDFLFTLLDKDNSANNQTYQIAKVLGGKWVQNYEVRIGDNYLAAPLGWSVAAKDWQTASYRPEVWFTDDGTPDGRPRKLEELPLDEVAEAKCAGCHTTGFEFAKDKKTGVWKAKGDGEMGIACEKCHGPGSLHVKAAQEAKAAGRKLEPGTSAIVHGLKDLDPLQQTQMCAQCHGRNTNKTNPEIAFPLGFLPGDTDLTSRAMFWSYSGTSDNEKAEHFWPNDWSKRNGQQWQDFAKSIHFNEARLSCLTCHTFHGKYKVGFSKQAQLRLKPEKLCVSCHSENGYALRPNAEMFAGSPMEQAGVRCVDCHMAKTGRRANRTVKGAPPWDVSSHTFLVATPALQKLSGVRSACMACHEEGRKALPHIKKGVEIPVFSVDELRTIRADKQAVVRSMVEEVRAVLRGITSQRSYVRARVDRANSLVDFVLLDHSMGLHNSEKSEGMLKRALELANRAAKLK